MSNTESLNVQEGLSIHYFCEPGRCDDAKRVFAFRKSVLVDLHGWQLDVEGNQERDEFDRPDTVHAVLYRDQDTIGAFRAIRSDRPYLAATKFPALATDRHYAKSSHIWEISRLTVAPGERRFETSMLVYAGMFHFIRLQGGVSIVGFCDLAHQRLLERIGIETNPYGPPMQIGTDTMGRPINVVAGEMPLPSAPSLKFQKLMAHIERMEVYDETAIFRHTSLSA